MELAESILIALASAVWAFSGIRLSIIDFREKLLPTKIIVPTFLVVLVLYIAAAVTAQDISMLGWALAGAAGCYCGFYALYLISSKAIGGGDVRLAGLNGLIVGWYGPAQPWLAIGAAFILSFPVALVMVAVRGPKSATAFGPYIVMGSAIFVGLGIVDLNFNS